MNYKLKSTLGALLRVAVAMTIFVIAVLNYEKLKNIDEVAYIRFASVYRRFQDVQSFIGEIEQFLEEK